MSARAASTGDCASAAAAVSSTMAVSVSRRAGIHGTLATRRLGCQTARVDSPPAVADARRVIAVGVQTWGTDLRALRRYWAAADALGYARVTYGDGLWDWTHDGWTRRAARARETGGCRIGPAVTYAFDRATHHVSWLAKRAVAVDHLSSGRLDVRFAVGAQAPGVADAWRRHGIAYPPPAERLARLEAVVHALRRLWAGESVTSAPLALREARVTPAPVQRGGPPVWIAAMRPRAIALAARCADGWEASFLAPAAFGEATERLDTARVAAGPPPGAGRPPGGLG